jgi:hypothetical protein
LIGCDSKPAASSAPPASPPPVTVLSKPVHLRELVHEVQKLLAA